MTTTGNNIILDILQQHTWKKNIEAKKYNIKGKEKKSTIVRFKMGIYWYAYDRNSNEYFSSPTNYKGNGCISPDNPFPQMVVMKNMRGCYFDIVNDVSWDMPDGAIDITNKVYNEYLELFPEAKEFYEKT